MNRKILSWVSPQIVVAVLCSSVAGSLLTWWLTHPRPTTIVYQVTTTKLGGVEGLFPDLRLKFGQEEIQTAYVHTVEFVSESGPFLDKADPLIAFPPGTHILGNLQTKSPSPVHKIGCFASRQNLQCSMGPFTGKGERFSISVASSQPESPHVYLAQKGVDLVVHTSTDRDSFVRTCALIVVGVFVLISIPLLFVTWRMIKSDRKFDRELLAIEDARSRIYKNLPEKPVLPRATRVARRRRLSARKRKTPGA